MSIVYNWPYIPGGVFQYTNFASFPASASDGTLAEALDTKNIYAYDVGSSSWLLVAGPESSVDKNLWNEERITLSGTNITNQFIDLAHPIFGSSASNNSASLTPVGGPLALKTVDYSVSLTGGSGGVTRITFLAGLATGGASALTAGNILIINYLYS